MLGSIYCSVISFLAWRVSHSLHRKLHAGRWAYMHCTGGTECLSRTPGSHSVCAVRTPLGVDQKIFSIRKELMLSGLFTLNVAARCATEAFSTTCAYKGLEGWPLSGCCGSVVEHWRLKPGVQGSTPGDCRFFLTFL